MAARINERTQFVDEAGLPLAGGAIYIGTQGADPKTNLITIYSDRALTTTLANPQTLDADGRSTNKIWIDGDYSMQVDDSGGTQQLQDLDAGVETTDSGVTPLTNVTGTDTIAAEATPTITAYVDGEIYVFPAANANTGAVTLNIDTVGAKSIRINLVDELVANDLTANGYVVVVYNLGQDVFEWINQNTSNLEAVLLLALQPTGLSQAWVGLTAPAGWVLADGGTIGNAASGGSTRANADTEDLFTLFYNSMADAQAPVSGGRTTGAAADFALNKTIQISDLKGSMCVGTGGTAPAIHGDSGGSETVQLVEAEMPSHTHSANLNALAPRSGGGTTGGGAIVIQITGSTGGDIAHENMPPWVSLNWVIKL